MNILAVDTSCRSLLVAVKTDTYFEGSNTESLEFKHSERIMGVILKLLANAGLKTTDIDLFVCTRGPGSFTGLRIGMATLKGMAYGSGKPLVSVSTLEMWAHTVQHFEGLTIPCIDAKKQRFYLAAFDCNNGLCKRLMPDIDGNVENLSEIAEQYGNILVVGPDKKSFASILPWKKNIVTEAEECISPAQSLIECALAQFRNQGADDIGQGPVYLRKSDAEIAYEEKLKGENSDG